MPVLPYCVLLTKFLGKLPAKGVLDTEVQTKNHDSLAGIFSEMEISQITAKTFQQAALEFHQVVHSIFEYAAVIPFRFPTWLSAEELLRHLEKESGRYESFLTRYEDHVQMELRLKRSVAGESERLASSGTEHLRVRAAQLHQSEQAVKELKQLLSADALEWRERDIPGGKRLFALVERSHIPTFRERLSQRNLQSSGPWPATEFLA